MGAGLGWVAVSHAPEPHPVAVLLLVRRHHEAEPLTCAHHQRVHCNTQVLLLRASSDVRVRYHTCFAFLQLRYKLLINVIFHSSVWGTGRWKEIVRDRGGKEVPNVG